MTSHRVVWVRKGVAEAQPFEVPSPGEGQALVRTSFSLISPGTERAFFLGLPNAVCEFPLISPGYSLVGEVAQLGAKVEGLKIGQRVACSAGHAGHVVMNAGDCLPLPDGVSEEQAAFFNLITITLQGVRKARVELGEPVVVLGAGLIGLLAMRLAKLCGALPAICVDKDERRLEFARQFGADAVLAADDKLPEVLQRLCEPSGASVVIEATGSPQAIVQAFSLTRRLGRVILLGSTRGETERVNFYRDVHQKGLTVVGAHNSTRPPQDSHPGWWSMRDDFRVSLKLLATRRLELQSLITHRFPWQQIPQAYELLSQWDGNAQGMLLDWRGA
ncbi:MAG: zinc-binding alcohol dehydrogenase [Verrucomicrobia bacterium]|nr:zinc-binding alcohol dehydrogenase [Verrucomicrobiota bacterium]